MPSETAVAVGNALVELRDGAEYITPFSLAAISSVTPSEIRVVFDSFQKEEQPEAPAEGSEDETT
jgi:hypothetical protein